MAKLFIANTSKQIYDFCYRLPEEKNFRTEKIQIGQQALIGGGKFSPDQIAHIINQQADGVLTDANTISRLNLRAGLCYRLEKSVDMERIMALFEHNDKHMNSDAEGRREANAEAISKLMEDRSHELGVPLNRSEVEIVEETPKNGGTPRIATGLEVVRDGKRPNHTGRQRRGRSAN